MKMDWALNNLQMLICHKTQQINQTNQLKYVHFPIDLFLQLNFITLIFTLTQMLKVQRKRPQKLN